MVQIELDERFLYAVEALTIEQGVGCPYHLEV